MFSRVVIPARLCARHTAVRRFGFMEDMIKKQMANATEKVLNDPDALAKAMAQFQNIGNSPLGQNKKIKEMIDNMGGMENIQRMFADPNFSKNLKDMMSNPEHVKKASEKMADLLKDDDTTKQIKE